MVVITALSIAGGGRGASAAESAGLEVDIEGRVDVDLAQRTATARGAIRISQDGFRVCCAQVELQYGDSGVRRADCHGGAVLVVLDPQGKGSVGTADRLSFVEGTFHVAGRVRLWAAGGRLEGNEGSYDAEGRRIRLVGDPVRWRADAGRPHLPFPCDAANSP